MRTFFLKAAALALTAAMAVTALAGCDTTLGGNTGGGGGGGGDEEIPGGEIPGGEIPGGGDEEIPGGEIPGGETPGGETPGGNNLTLPSITPKNAELLDTIRSNNNGNHSVHNSLNASEAGGVMYDLLLDYKSQANGLIGFINGVQNADKVAGLESKLSGLKAAQTAILNLASSSTVTLDNYPDALNTQRDAAINAIFGGGTTQDKSAFNACLAAYKKWHYLMTRDWATGPDAQDTATAAVDSYIALVNNARSLDNSIPTVDPGAGNPQYYYDNGRGTSFDTPGNSGDLENALANAMKAKIVTALGLSGVANADNMAEALVIQLGQDMSELQAFIEDLQLEGIQINNVYPGQLAQAQTQSNVRLAHVDSGTTFSPEVVKGAYGSKRGGNRRLFLT